MGRGGHTSAIGARGAVGGTGWETQRKRARGTHSLEWADPETNQDTGKKRAGKVHTCWRGRQRDWADVPKGGLVRRQKESDPLTC